MQRNPQTPQTQRPAARPQQAYSSSGARPVRPPYEAAASARPVNRPPQQRPARAPQAPLRQPVQSAQRPVQRQVSVQRPQAPARPAVQAAQRRTSAPVPQQRRPVQQAPSVPFRGRQDTRTMIITAIAAGIVLLAGCLMQFVVYPMGYFPEHTASAVTTVAEISSSRGVRINEVMTSNKTAMSDASGAYPDWIELINASNGAVDITGWALLDKASRSTYFVFPDYQLDPGETVVVFASGKLADENGADFQAPFRMSSAGDTLMLSDAHGTVVESINIPALGANQSYAQMNGGWQVTSEYTPGMENTALNYAALTSTQPVAGSALVISEIMADNASYPSAGGALYDFIEVQNIGSNPVDLNGYALSDSPDKPSQWKFPSVTLQPGQCALVYATGLEQTNGSELHASFGLRAEGESVLLYSPTGQVLDYVEYDNLKKDQSIRRQSDGSYITSGSASPGQAN